MRRGGAVAIALVATSAVAWPAGARSAVTDGELRASVTPLVPRSRPLAPRGSVSPLQRRTGRRGGDIAADVLFDFGRAAVRPAGRTAVRRLARAVAGRSGTLRVVGHTDGVGGARSNRRLSRLRAAAVAAILRPGLPRAVRIVAIGRGSAEPVASEATADGRDDPGGRARNRRVGLRFSAR